LVSRKIGIYAFHRELLIPLYTVSYHITSLRLREKIKMNKPVILADPFIVRRGKILNYIDYKEAIDESKST